MRIRSVGQDDAGAIHTLTRRWESYWDVPMVTPLFEIEEELSRPHFDLERDTRSYWDGSRLVAYGQIWHRPSGMRLERAYAQGRVDPEYRNRGIGRELLSWQINRATEILRSADNDLPKFVRADEWDWIEENHRLYLRFGMRPARYFTEMLKELKMIEPIPKIEDVEIVSWDRSLDDQALDVINKSFADHWGSTPADADSFKHRLDGHGVRLDQSFLALAGGRVIGVALNSHYPEDEELLGRRDGWVETLGVLKEWRRRGVASALLGASCNAFLDSSFTHSALGVDAANPTDALKLYTGLNYEPTHRSITSELEVT